jgi:hypothetical protein
VRDAPVFVEHYPRTAPTSSTILLDVAHRLVLLFLLLLRRPERFLLLLLQSPVAAAAVLATAARRGRASPAPGPRPERFRGPRAGPPSRAWAPPSRAAAAAPPIGRGAPAAASRTSTATKERTGRCRGRSGPARGPGAFLLPPHESVRPAEGAAGTGRTRRATRSSRRAWGPARPSRPCCCCCCRSERCPRSRGAGRPRWLPGRNDGGPVAVDFVPYPGARCSLVWVGIVQRRRVRRRRRGGRPSTSLLFSPGSGGRVCPPLRAVALRRRTRVAARARTAHAPVAACRPKRGPLCVAAPVDREARAPRLRSPCRSKRARV